MRRAPCSDAPSPPAAKSPSLTPGPTFVTLRRWKRTLSASDSGPTPRKAKSDFLSVKSLISYHVAALAIAGRTPAIPPPSLRCSCAAQPTPACRRHDGRGLRRPGNRPRWAIPPGFRHRRERYRDRGRRDDGRRAEHPGRTRVDERACGCRWRSWSVAR